MKMRAEKSVWKNGERGVAVTEYGIMISLLTVTAFAVFPTLADLWRNEYEWDEARSGGQAQLDSLVGKGSGGGTGGGADGGSTPPADGGGGSSSPWVDPFTIGPDGITLTSGGAPTINILGGAITYGAGGPNVPISLDVLINGVPQQIFKDIGPNADPSVMNALGDIPAGTALDFKGTSYYPPGHAKAGQVIYTKSTTTSNPMIIALRNGDYVPDYTPFDQQPAIKTFMSGVIDPNTSIVTIGPNEVLYLMELGTNNTSSPAADFQDLVFKITF